MAAPRAFVLLAVARCSTAKLLGLTLSSDAASFHVTLDGSPWLSGGEVIVDNCSASAKTLLLVGAPNVTSGVDALGEFSETAVSWAKSSAPTVPVMIASYKTYSHDEGVIVFTQRFPIELGVQPSADAALAARTVFPGFDRAASRDLACFAYHGVFPALHDCTLSTYKESFAGGAPLTFYDSRNASLPMAVFSPLSMPLAHHMASSSAFVGAGVKATVKTIPAGWSQSFMLSAGTGIHAGMMMWGDRMLKVSGKPRADMYKDDTHGKIGFWTDNGGYYHYAIGNNKSLGSNYEEVLPKVKAYHDSIGVPFGHWQFDSWFYPKDGGVNPGGGGGAVTNWTADPSIFPHGMAYIQSKLGLPTVMHNRQWSTKSDYIHNLSQFEWYTSKYAVPKDPIAFFDWFFKQQDGWGLSMYEQDWMCTEYEGVSALQENITMGDLWLKGMADGAASSGRTVQYCMPYPNQVLSAVSYAAVTNARATGDYFHAAHQWAIGATSLFYWAIGILPFKDGYYSSTHKQEGGQTVGPELNPDREALMATLSGAMVGPMDGIFLLNKTRVMTSCAADGTVLKPDAPVHTSDWCFVATDDAEESAAPPRSAGGAECYVYRAYSDVSETWGRVQYVYNDAGGAPLTPRMAHLAPSDVGNYAVYNWYTGELMMLAASTPLTGGYEGHNYAVVSPVNGGWIFLGEVDKYVTASSKRFGAVQVSGGTLKVQVRGFAAEQVRVCAAKKSDLQVVCKAVDFAAAGWEDVSFGA